MPLPDLFTDAPNAVDYSTVNPDVIRTIIGEGDPAHVASVLFNRKQKSGLDYGTLVTDPSQFNARTGDAWSTNSKIPETDPRYQKALKIAGPILAGVQKPVTAADMFYQPKAMADGAKPSWDDGSGVAGPDGQLYFTDKYSPPKVPALFADAPSGNDSGVYDSATGAPLPDYQAQEARKLQAEKNGLVIDPETNVAIYKGMPMYQSSGSEEPQKPGDYWIDRSGALHQVPVDYNGAANYADNALLGTGNKLMAGIQALKASGGDLNDPMFKSGDYYNQALSHYQGEQQAYAQEHPVAAGVTQDLGQFSGVAPTLAVGGEVLSPLRAVMGPAGDFLAGASRGNALLRAGSQATNGAIQGAAAAGLTGSNVVQGALTGGLMNPLVHGIGSAVTNKFFPFVSQPTADLADKAINTYNYNLTGAQIHGAEDAGAAAVHAKLAATPGSEFAGMAAQNATTRMRNISNTFGEDTDKLTQPALKSAYDRIGTGMNDVASRNNITNTDGLLSNLGNIVNDAKVGGVSDEALKTLQSQVENVGSRIEAGKLSGTAYKSLITKGSGLDSAARNVDPNVNFYAQKMKGALNAAFDAEAAPGDADAMSQYRNQYHNLMAVKDHVDAAGQISTAGLQSAVDGAFPGRRLYGGAGGLGDLADIDNQFMNHSVKPDSWLSKAGHFTLPGLASGGVGAALMANHPMLAAEIAGGSTAAGIAGHYLGTPVSELMNNNPALVNRLLQGTRASRPGQFAADLTNQLPVPAATVGTSNLFQQQQNKAQ